jgi:hypothetical protein
MSPARNVVFFSPQLPDWVTAFAIALGRDPEVNLLCVSDQPYESLPSDLVAVLTEYYKINTLDNEDEVAQAVQFFRDKYGSVDRFESLNEHWLGLEARIRDRFDIVGPRPDFIEQVTRKSKMKAVFDKAGVATIQGTVVTTIDDALAFTGTHGYPVIVKPDTGAGASSTYRVDNDDHLRHIFDSRPDPAAPVVVEQFMDARIFTFDGMVDADGQIIFASSTLYDQSVMEVVNSGDNAYYITLPEVPANVREAGEAIVKAYDLRERYFHIEIFDRRDGKGLVGLEINMRPPGAWMTDAANVANSTDVYGRWTAMISGQPQPQSGPDLNYSAYASRKNFNHYAHSREECFGFIGDRLVKYRHIEAVFAPAMGDEAFLVRAQSMEEAREMIAYVQQRA